MCLICCLLRNTCISLRTFSKYGLWTCRFPFEVIVGGANHKLKYESETKLRRCEGGGRGMALEFPHARL